MTIFSTVSRRPLVRILSQSLHYPATFFGVIACSLGIALLWGGNIGGLYPIFQVFIAGESLQAWVASEIDDSEENIRDLKHQIENAEKSNANDKHSSVASLKSRLRSEQSSLSFKRFLHPWIDKYLPNDPFMTLAVIIALLLAAVLLRQVLLISSAILKNRLKNNNARLISRLISNP